MFIDRAVVQVTAGTGGSGAASFARFKYKPKGGPDGGDGGRGGSVFVRGDANLATLLDYRYRTVWRAERGEHGKGKTQTGASSADVYLPVPPGTEVRDAEWSPELIRPYVEVALESFGPDRVMFGTDWPVCRLRCEYGTWVETVAALVDGLSADEQAAIWAGTATRVYGL
jgi:GTPase involved in cell partitioning and DNA repair